MKIITVAEVQKGDRIRVTVYMGDRTTSYVGVADHVEKSVPRWRTHLDCALWTDLTDAVIELLERPKPKIELPTGEYAVVTYEHYSVEWTGVFQNGEWRVQASDDLGSAQAFAYTKSPAGFAEKLADRTNIKVLFGGVK